MNLKELDIAVALLELGYDCEALGRAVFAILVDAGCAEGVALIETSPAGARVVVSHGRTHGPVVVPSHEVSEDAIILGSDKDLSWQLLVRPRLESHYRATIRAVRRLVGTARALHEYRRIDRIGGSSAIHQNDYDLETVWASRHSAEVFNVALRVATTGLPVFLSGESGTGKELLARAIHRASDRPDASFQPFDCAAVPGDMIESQLFGYRKGAFTGADAPFPGVIRAAAGGTLFLDEIGEIPLDIQPKLLRFLEHHEVQPLGEAQPVTVDVRIIAATNSNLEQLIAQGRFREDLYYRLNVIPLRLPPLRERREEIPALLQHYIRRHSDDQRKGQLTLSDETLEYLLLYAWPGNIRQLANEVRRMVALAEPDSTLTPDLLSPDILASRRTIAATAVPDAEIRLRLDQPLPVAVELLEQTLVRRALERTHGRVEEAARLLGISRKGLFLKRRRWGLERAS